MKHQASDLSSLRAEVALESRDVNLYIYAVVLNVCCTVNVFSAQDTFEKQGFKMNISKTEQYRPRNCSIACK